MTRRRRWGRRRRKGVKELRRHRGRAAGQAADAEGECLRICWLRQSDRGEDTESSSYAEGLLLRPPPHRGGGEKSTTSRPTASLRSCGDRGGVLGFYSCSCRGAEVEKPTRSSGPLRARRRGPLAPALLQRLPRRRGGRAVEWTSSVGSSLPEGRPPDGEEGWPLPPRERPLLRRCRLTAWSAQAAPGWSSGVLPHSEEGGKNKPNKSFSHILAFSIETIFPTPCLGYTT